MPKYLLQVSYTTEGAKGLLREGGTKRRAHIEDLVRKLGGRLEAFYYAFGEDDVFVISEAPDDATAAAISLAICASGAVRAKTTVLITPETMDEAARKQVGYRPPGA